MSKPWRLLSALVLVAIAFGLRAPFLGRQIWNIDEGVTFTIAHQILDGGLIYRDAVDHRNPLVPYLQAAAFGTGGQWDAVAVHASLALLLGLAAVGLWRLARRLGDNSAGLAAAAVFTPLAFLLPDAGDALAAHTEWYLLLFSVAGFWSLAAALGRPGFLRGAATGALFGLGTLCKQPGLLDFGVALVLVALSFLGRAEHRAALFRLLLGLAAGLALILGATIAYFAAHGALRELAYYAWTYNSRIYVPELPLPQRLLSLRDPFVYAWRHIPAALVLGAAGAVLLLGAAVRSLFRRPGPVPILVWLALGWTATGIIAPALSGRGFSHYSIQVVPGLSLACGWALMTLWRWCAPRRKLWRVSALGALALLIACTTVDTTRRLRQLAQAESPRLAEVCTKIRSHSSADERIFVWGFAPDLYFLTQRLPASRFIYFNFLTGIVPWTNLDSLKDTAYAVAPGSWDQLRVDFERHPPALIVDIASQPENVKFPLRNQPVLWSLVTSRFVELAAADLRDFEPHVYRRFTPGDGGPPPASARTDDRVQLALGFTNELHSLPRVTLRAPAGASRADLYLDNRLLRSVPLPDGKPDIVFFLPPTTLPGGTSRITAGVHYPDAVLLSTPLSLDRDQLEQHARTGTGPVLRFRGEAIQPGGSTTAIGAPSRLESRAGAWLLHAPATIEYRRPEAMSQFDLEFGIDPRVYFDGDGVMATDGAAFAVDFIPDGGAATRVFTRSLDPRAAGCDQGPQRAQITLPGNGPGRILIHTLPGPAGKWHSDWTWLGDLAGLDSGPCLRFGSNLLVFERVHSHAGALMRPNNDGTWSAHSPSEITYAGPPAADTLAVTFGLQPASYDGSRDGKTDGIDLIVTAELGDGSTRELFRRTIDPANTPADQGPQTARIPLSGLVVRRLTIAIGPGPAGSFAYDWSYLGKLELEGVSTARP